MDKQNTQNPQKFEPHGNYQPYGITKSTRAID